MSATFLTTADALIRRRRAARGRGVAPTGRSTSTFQACWKPRIAKATSSACSGTRIAVSSPITSDAIAGSVKPSLSRSNQPGTDTRAKMNSTIASAAASGRTPRLQRSTRNAIPR